MHFFPKKHCFWPKKALFLPKDQNSICMGLKFSSESKLFGEGPSCVRLTSTTLSTFPSNTFTIILHRMEKTSNINSNSDLFKSSYSDLSTVSIKCNSHEKSVFYSTWRKRVLGPKLPSWCQNYHMPMLEKLCAQWGRSGIFEELDVLTFSPLNILLRSFYDLHV